jgi:hypothetical protein
MCPCTSKAHVARHTCAQQSNFDVLGDCLEFLLLLTHLPHDDTCVAWTQQVSIQSQAFGLQDAQTLPLASGKQMIQVRMQADSVQQRKAWAAITLVCSPWMGPPDLMLPSTMLNTSSNQGSLMRLISSSLVAGRGMYLPNSSITNGFPYDAACAARAASHRLHVNR